MLWVWVWVWVVSEEELVDDYLLNEAPPAELLLVGLVWICAKVAGTELIVMLVELEPPDAMKGLLAPCVTT